nr:hypothetical protein [Tanacetum cinerariifolium]
MIWHATGKCTEPGKMQHPIDGRVWKKFDIMYLDFAKETRNVRLGLAADGFNPFGNLSQAYSMWPVILTTYNLPPPLIEDLKVLWDRKGVETIDVVSGQKFNMRAIVLWTINDFSAQSSLSGDPPKEFGRDEILAQLDRLPMLVKGKHPSYGGVKIKLNVHVELNWTKRSIFYELKYWSFLTLRHNLDIMHIEKNVLEAIFNTLLMNDKSKDAAKARQDLQMLGIRSGLWLGQTKNGKCLKPQATYSFTPENRKKFSKPEGSIAEGYVAEEALTFSSYYFWDVIPKFNHPDRNFDAQELKKVKWYAVHNSPEIDTYRSQFKSLFPNKDVKEEFPDWFRSQICQHHIDNDKDPEVSTTCELFALAYGPTWTPILVNSCVVDGVSLNDLDNATLHIDCQSTEVDTPPYIIDVPDEDDDIIDDEDAIPHDLADYDDEDLINVDDDDDVARSHGGDGDGGGEDRPSHTMYPPVVGVASLTEAK